jgi:hypothetical protein
VPTLPALSKDARRNWNRLIQKLRIGNPHTLQPNDADWLAEIGAAAIYYHEYLSVNAVPAPAKERAATGETVEEQLPLL